MDEQNPAVKNRIAIPPALLDEVGQDAKVAEQYARKIFFVNLDRLQRQMQDPAITAKQRLDYLEQLAKWGLIGSNKPAAANTAGSGPGFSVNIVLPSPTASPAVQPAVVIKQDVEVLDNAPTPPDPPSIQE